MSDAPRSPRSSQTVMTELVLPQHANAIGTAFGGSILSWIDICAAIAAQRHCGRVAVTAAIDEMQFLAPIRVGDTLVLRAQVNAAFNTSMEVEVTVEREEHADGSTHRTLCADAILTFVNRDDDGKPVRVPPLACETDDDRRRLAAARSRRERRLTK
jgi:acyl-CoA hydrolase